jgi:hypothetical protein
VRQETGRGHRRARVSALATSLNFTFTLVAKDLLLLPIEKIT